MRLPQLKDIITMQNHLLSYGVVAVEIGLVTLLAHTWSVRYQPESYFLTYLAAFIALPFVVSLQFLSKRHNLLTAAALYGSLFLIASIFLENLILQTTPALASVTIYAIVCVLIAVCLIAEAVILVIQRFLPSLSIYRSLVLGGIVIVAVVFWFKGGGRVLEHEIALRLPKATTSATEPTLASKNLYVAINNYRIAHRLPALQQNEALEKAAHAFIEKAKKSPQSYYKLAFDEQLKQDLATSSGYPYYKIADIYGTDGNDKTEQAVVDHWVADEGIRQTLLDSEYFDIGLAFTTGMEENPNAYVIYVLLGNTNRPTVSPAPAVNPSNAPISLIDATYTGVDVFAAVNKSRTEHGVNPLQQRNELCTVASIRLNQQIDNGKLDNHDGFQAVLDKYKDQLDYSRVAENLAGGYPTAAETVKAWEGSPGHAVLLKDGSFVWGCTAANHGFSVLIAAY